MPETVAEKAGLLFDRRDEPYSATNAYNHSEPYLLGRPVHRSESTDMMSHRFMLTFALPGMLTDFA